MPVFAVCVTAAAAGFSAAYEAGRASGERACRESRSRNKPHPSRPFKAIAGGSDYRFAALLACLLVFETWLLPRSWNPFWQALETAEASSPVSLWSRFVCLLVYGCWSGVLAIGYGGVSALCDALHDERELLEKRASEHRRAANAAETALEEEDRRLSSEKRALVASLAAAAGEWRRLEASRAEHDRALEARAENDRVWSGTLSEQLDAKTKSLVDNAMDQRWRDVEHSTAGIEEMRKKNAANQKRLREQKALRAERANAQQTELEGEKQKLEALKGELKDLGATMEALKEENAKKEREAIDALKEREERLREKEKSFEETHGRELERLTKIEEDLRAREERFSSGEERLELLRKSEKLDSSMVNVARFKKEIEISEKAKLDEIEKQRRVLIDQEKQLREIARKRQIELEEQEERLKEGAQKREIELLKQEEEIRKKAEQRKTELAKEEEVLRIQAEQRKTELAKREEELEEIARKRDEELKEIENKRREIELGQLELEFKEVAKKQDLLLEKRKEELKKKTLVVSTDNSDAVGSQSESPDPNLPGDAEPKASSYYRSLFELHEEEEGPEDEMKFGRTPASPRAANLLSPIAEDTPVAAPAVALESGGSRQEQQRPVVFQSGDEVLMSVTKSLHSGAEAVLESMKLMGEQVMPDSLFTSETNVENETPVVDQKQQRQPPAQPSSSFRPASLMDLDEDDDIESTTSRTVADKEPAAPGAQEQGKDFGEIKERPRPADAAAKITDGSEARAFFPDSMDQHQNRGTNRMEERDDEDERPQAMADNDMERSWLQPEEARDPIDNTASRKHGRPNHKHKVTNSIFDSDSEDDSLSYHIQRDIAKKNRREEELEPDGAYPTGEKATGDRVGRKASPLKEISEALRVYKNADKKSPGLRVDSRACGAAEKPSYTNEIPVSPTSETSASSNASFTGEIPMSPTATTSNTTDFFKGIRSIAHQPSDMSSVNYGDRYGVFVNKAEEREIPAKDNGSSRRRRSKRDIRKNKGRSLVVSEDAGVEVIF